MTKTFTIAASTSRKDIKAALRSRSSQISIDLNQSAADLLTIFAKTKQIKNAGAILQLLAIHPSADSDLLEQIATHAEAMGDSGVLNAVATAPHVSVNSLQRLARYPDRFVREHATLALMAIELSSAAPERFAEVYDAHANDSEEDVAVRSVLVYHPRTPKDVIEKLKNDPVEAIARVAISRAG